MQLVPPLELIKVHTLAEYLVCCRLNGVKVKHGGLEQRGHMGILWEGMTLVARGILAPQRRFPGQPCMGRKRR
jgi:hypothetical protein